MKKNKPIGFIVVRSSSSRLPNKCYLPLGNCSVLEHVIRRAISYDIDPIVCTSTDESDNAIEEIASREGIRCYRGSLNNKLKRLLDCADQFNIKSFHTIDADDPFFDGEEMKKSMALLESGHYDAIAPTASSSAGGASVGYSLTRDIVHQALIGLDDDTDTEMMWYFLEKISNLRLKELEESKECLLPLRLTLDYEEDYWLLASICRMLGNSAGRNEINQLFFSNPDLYKINWFRNQEWKAAQLSKKQV